MEITATELKMKLGYYLELAQTTDIIITKNGLPIARLGSPYADKREIAKSLRGILSQDVTREDARKGRVNDYEALG